MKTEKWVNNIIDEYREDYFPIASLTFDDLSNIYFGASGSSRSPGGRKTWSALWINYDLKMLPLGLFACSCSGFWKHNKEYGVLEIGKQKIILSRDGNSLYIQKNDKIIGEINYGTWLRLIYFGSSTLTFPSGMKGKIYLPVNGPSAYNIKDCLGRICFNNSCNVKYLIATQDKTIEIIERDKYNFPFRSYCLNISPIYSNESCEILKQFNGDEGDFYVFLIIACWSRMFYTYW